MLKDAEVKILVSKALEHISPNEIMLIEHYDPERKADGSTARGPQGFGAADAIVLFLPYFYTFFQGYVEGFGSQAGKISFDKISSWLSDPNEKNKESARFQIRTALEAQGLESSVVENATNAVMDALAAKHEHK